MSICVCVWIGACVCSCVVFYSRICVFDPLVKMEVLLMFVQRISIRGDDVYNNNAGCMDSWFEE